MLFYKFRKKHIDKILENWEEEKRVLKYEQALREVRAGARRKISTSKLILLIMIIILTVIMFFCGFFTYQMLAIVAATGAVMDFTPLCALITTVAGEVVITLGYFIKSTKENSESGITYQHMMNEFELEKMNYGEDER